MRSSPASRVPLALTLLGALFLLAACGPEPDTAAAFDHRHALFDRVLRAYVEDGLVDYAALKDDPATLDRYLDAVGAVTEAQYEGWTREQKLAYWINAYNAYTIKVVLQHYPIGRSIFADPLERYPASSIRQIPGVWKLRWWAAAGERYTLDHMEHVIMRQEIGEPRIHFVLVCASLGCPKLESRSFDAEHLDQRLDQAAVNYIYRDDKVGIDREDGVMRLPRIFDWFAEDFQPLAESAAFFEDRPAKIAGPLTWIYRYANERDRAFLQSGSYRVEYLPYDWGLNDQEP
ncbi:MAG: DUF547 domain-containing protein [Gammaproteobacteria bacterium]|nr:DUF547 domain-containing protein [Gammaproteobacteria bacterium]